MNWILWLVVAWLAFGALFTVAAVGKTRSVITPGVAVGALIIQGIVIAALIIGGHLS